MLTGRPAIHEIERMSDAEPNLPRAAQAQIGRRLRVALSDECEAELPAAMREALAALEARLSSKG